jgi:hypothetical protein
MRIAAIAAATLHSWIRPRTATRIHAWQDASGVRVSAVCGERKWKPASGWHLEGRPRSKTIRGPQANVIGRLLKIELDLAESECCTAPSAVQ